MCELYRLVGKNSHAASIPVLGANCGVKVVHSLKLPMLSSYTYNKHTNGYAKARGMVAYRIWLHTVRAPQPGRLATMAKEKRTKEQVVCK